MTCPANSIRKDNWYSRLVARYYDPFMHQLELKLLSRKRRALLSTLEGNILEVGAGTGVNFVYYGPQARVTAIEPSQAMLNHARKKLDDHSFPARITLLHAGIGDELPEGAIPPEGFDAIVCTLVLCTIPNAFDAIRQFREWLHPQGRLILLEHIRSERSGRRLLQHLFNPLWKRFAEGCNLNRPTDRWVRDAGFQYDELEYFQAGLPFFSAVCRKNRG